jgi:hypothetical protein
VRRRKPGQDGANDRRDRRRPRGEGIHRARTKSDFERRSEQDGEADVGNESRATRGHAPRRASKDPLRCERAGELHERRLSLAARDTGTVQEGTAAAGNDVHRRPHLPPFVVVTVSGDAEHRIAMRVEVVRELLTVIGLPFTRLG